MRYTLTVVECRACSGATPEPVYRELTRCILFTSDECRRLELDPRQEIRGMAGSKLYCDEHLTGLFVVPHRKTSAMSEQQQQQ